MMPRRDFEELVARALEGLPRPVLDRLENVEVLVQTWPTREQLRQNRVRSRYGLLGLYEGVPLTARDSSYGLVLPDRITIFQGPLEAICETPEEVEEQVRKTVVHEVAHWFGISDAELRRLGY